MIRLLLTEGNPTARQELRLGLAAAAGLEVVAAAGTGPELLAALATAAPSVLLLDLALPGADAFGLSKREMEVLALVSDGLTNAEIADKLFTSKRTVETHRQNIMDKTQTRNTAALIKMAARQGLLPE